MSLEDLIKIKELQLEGKNLYVQIYRTYGFLLLYEDGRIIYNSFREDAAFGFNLYICWDKRKRSLLFLRALQMEFTSGNCKINVKEAKRKRVPTTVILYYDENRERAFSEEVILIRHNKNIYLLGYTDKKPQVTIPYFYDRYTGLYVFLLTKKLFSRIA